MIINYLFINILLAIVIHTEAARILVVAPTASISHQVEFRPLTQELARRGHEVVVITTDPAFPKGKTPENLTEIDVHNVTYTAKNNGYATSATGSKNDIFIQVKLFLRLFHIMFEALIQTDEVKEILNYDKHHFDLLILEAASQPSLILSHIFEAPVILFSSLASFEMINDYTGPAMHPLLYPTLLHQKTNNLTLLDKAYELFKHYLFIYTVACVTEEGDVMLRRNFGKDIPSTNELARNVDMVFFTEYHIWDNNRPVPPNVLYLGGIHPPQSSNDLPKNLKDYLDSSIHGVIYVSFGTNVNTTLLPQQAVQTFVKVFSKLPYDILLRWETDVLPGATENVKLFKWLPQSDILRHPKIKLFINQGGLQSTSEAIEAAVPLIGMPMLGDQWFNVEQYERLKIGLKLVIDTINEETMLALINTVIEDKSFRHNIEHLRRWSHDQPQTALDRAVWWTEHVIRFKGAKHLRAPTALISYWDYFEVDLLLVVASCVILFIVIIATVVYKFISYILSLNRVVKRKNE